MIKKNLNYIPKMICWFFNAYVYEKTILIYLLARYATLHHILPVRKPIDEKEEMDTGDYEEKEEMDTEEG